VYIGASLGHFFGIEGAHAEAMTMDPESPSIGVVVSGSVRVESVPPSLEHPARTISDTHQANLVRMAEE
jgi:hypothetical protein